MDELYIAVCTLFRSTALESYQIYLFTKEWTFILVNASVLQLLCTLAHFSSNNHLFDFLHGFNLHLMSYFFNYCNKIFFEKKKPPWRESLFWLLAQGCSPLRWKVKAAGGWHGCSHRIHNQKAMVRSVACLTFSFLRPGPSPGNGVTHGGKVFLLPKPNQDNPATQHIQAAHISGKSRSQVTMETNYWTIFP